MVNVTRAFFKDPVIDLARQGVNDPRRRRAVRQMEFSTSDEQKRILEQTKKNVALREQERRIKEAKEREFRKAQRRVMFNDAQVAISGFRDKSLEELGRFGGVASGGQDFTPEQAALKQMFGGGEKIWGVNNNPVNIYNDLNPSQRGDDGTADLFGFGSRSERSGLF